MTDYFVNHDEMVGVRTSSSAFAPLKVRSNALKTAKKLVFAVLGPNTFPFALPLSGGKDVLGHLFLPECPILPSSGSNRTAALCHDELNASFISAVHSTM